jgi:hypothetical protein
VPDPVSVQSKSKAQSQSKKQNKNKAFTGLFTVWLMFRCSSPYAAPIGISDAAPIGISAHDGSSVKSLRDDRSRGVSPCDRARRPDQLPVLPSGLIWRLRSGPEFEVAVHTTGVVPAVVEAVPRARRRISTDTNTPQSS